MLLTGGVFYCFMNGLRIGIPLIAFLHIPSVIAYKTKSSQMTLSSESFVVTRTGIEPMITP